MNANLNYYEILGLKNSATQDEIKRAYRRLAKEYHPDRAGGSAAEERFKQISEAYSVLGNEQKRREYDLLRRGGFGFRGRNSGSYQTNFGEGLFENIQDLFSNLFGGNVNGQADRRRGSFEYQDLLNQERPNRMRGADMESQITVPFLLAINGGETIINTGSQKKVKIKIPPGVEDGKKIRIRGQGAPSPDGGPPGDLYLTIRVSPHLEFQRRGNDIHSHIYLDVAQAILGSEIYVKTVSNKRIKLKIPAGTGSGKIFRLPGMGIKSEGQQGDHFVRIEIDVPRNMSLTQKRDFKAWAHKMGLLKNA